MNQEVRNKLRNVVTQCRKLLEESISQELEGKYGIFAKRDQITADPNAPMTHLTEEEQSARKDILDHFGHVQARGFKPKDALDQLVREIAFTHLNRLCAYKMMEAREVYVGGQKFREAVSRGFKSNGFLHYLGMDGHEADERLYSTGQQDVAYRHFLDWLGGLLSEEIGVLFSPNDPANRLYPKQKTLDEVLALLNDGGIKVEEAELRQDWPKIWSQDETIGWVYQYFTPKELREAARDPKKGGSQAPRNSYELAFRNQFFTPRYVVKFLTDNTLGRIWYEMRKGDTKLKDHCQYMVCRPTEMFLKEGEKPPKETADLRDDLSQEELLNLAVHIPHRPKKDPRELKILDPACGSGHFLLYCFDLLLTIYEEAYADPDLSPALKRDYKTVEELRRDVPRLILAHNLHGIDIDLRCTQIAALALWLRCQRAYQEMGLRKERPQITRSNFVCAEPMPGEEEMLKEFIGQLEPRLLGQLVEVVFDKMKLAGEAGSLLKVEEEIHDAVAQARTQWLAGPLSIQQTLFDEIKPVAQQRFDFSGVTDTQFFEQAGSKVVEALRNYAEKAHNGQQFQRRLFSEDAARGFAFVDVCHKRYDVVLMNPPFGLGVKRNFNWLKDHYPDAYVDVFASFLSRVGELCTGKVGVISSRSVLMAKKLHRLRGKLLVPGMEVLADLGWPVMDGAMVQSCAYTYDAKGTPASRFLLAMDRRSQEPKGEFSLNTTLENTLIVDRAAFASLPQQRILYLLPRKLLSLLKSTVRVGPNVLVAKLGMKSFNDFRFLRLRAEINPDSIGKDAVWEPLSKGGPFAVFYSDFPLFIRWNKNGDEVAQENVRANGQTAQARQASKFYRLCGGTYSYRAKDFGVRMLPAGCIIGHKGPAIFAQAGHSNEFVIGFLNSRLVNCLVHVQANAKQFDSGIVESIPWHEIDASGVRRVEEITRNCIDATRGVALLEETDSLFVGLPSADSLDDLRNRWNKEVVSSQKTLAQSLEEINRIVDTSYGIDSDALRVAIDLEPDDDDDDQSSESDDDEEPSFVRQIGNEAAAKASLSYCVGVALGRWDVRISLENLPTNRLPQVFGDLPKCPPGLLQGHDEVPAHETPEGYPIRIEWDGILVDDQEASQDIMRRVLDVMEVIWKERTDGIEKHACEILGVKELRDYFRKPAKGGFWDDHVSRYTNSRRKAPIYWLLQSSKKNYAIWLYYHRLDKDLCFKALVNYVEPKIRLETSRLETFRSQKASAGETGKEAKRLAKEVELQEDFISELRDFEDKLRRAANLHLEPDLNDGVVLNIAPLYELIPWKEAKNYWDELVEGKYEWSSIGKQLRQRGLVK
jgi:hypothetical protein